MKQPNKVNFHELSPNTKEGLTIGFEKLLKMNIVGDYLEFGLYQGQSFSHAYYEMKRLKITNMHLWGFDSFSGFPETDDIDLDGLYTDAVKPYFKKGFLCCPKTEVMQNLKALGIDLSQISLVEGYYDRTLVPENRKKLKINNAAIVLIDSDLYKSCKLVLSFILPLLQKGTVLLFDDWNLYNKPERGEEKAFSEFLRDNRNIKVERYKSFGWHGQSFIVVAIS